MCSGKTENFQLPQYIGSDHPDFLDEINKAFKKIDDELSGVKSGDDTNSSSIEEIQKQLQTINSSLQTMQSSITTLQADVARLKGE